MIKERFFRTADAAAFDWLGPANVLDVPGDVAHALYVRAMQRVHDVELAEALYRHWLRCEADERRSVAAPAVIGRRTLVQEHAETSWHPRAGFAPGKLTRVLLEAAGKGAGLPEVEAAPQRPGRHASPRATGARRQNTRNGRRAAANDQVRAADSSRVRLALLALDGSGVPLPSGVESMFSRLLGVDLSDVRVHDDAAANDGAQQAGAQAFTAGRRIGFARGAFAPETSFGRHILAHELVHVAQQKAAGAEMRAARMDDGPSGAALEIEAEAGAAALTGGRPFQVARHAALPAVSFFTPEPRAPDGGAPDVRPGDAGTKDAGASDAGAKDAGTKDVGGKGTAPAPDGGAPAPAGDDKSTAAPSGKGGPAPGDAGASGKPGGQAPGQQVPPVCPPDPIDAAGRTDAPKDLAFDSKITDRIQAEMNKRADPFVKAQLEKIIGSTASLRIASLQYSFTPSSIWHNFWNGALLPLDNFKEHGRQIASDNAYRGGDGLISKIQVGIEGLRGVVHIVGDIIGMLAGWASLFTAAMAIATACGALVCGPLAAAGAAVALVLAALKVIADALDTVLGLLQLFLSCLRLRFTDDPGERAKICQLIKKEVNDFTTNLIQIGFQVLTIAAGAAAGAVAESLGKDSFMASFKAALRSQISQIKLAFGVRAGLKGLVTGGGYAKFVTDEAAKAAAANAARATAASTLAKAGERGIAVNEIADKHVWALAAGALHNENLAHAATLKSWRSGVVRSAAVQAVGLPQGIVLGTSASEVKLQSGLSGTAPRVATKAGGPRHETIESRYVAAWPMALDQMNTERGLVNNASVRMNTQYELARDDASDDTTSRVEKMFGTVTKENNRIRAATLQKRQQATADADQNQQAAGHAGKAKDEKTKADAKKGEANSAANQCKKEVDTASNTPPPAKPAGTLEEAWDWMKDHTLGALGRLIGEIQGWANKWLLRFFLWVAGAKDGDLDLAGMEVTARRDKTEDEKARDAADAASRGTDPIDDLVTKMRVGMTVDEQNALQGMVDTMRWISVLDDADQQFAEAVASGTTYVNEVGPHVEAELRTQEAVSGSEDAKIKADYIAPIIDGGLRFEGELAGTPDAFKEAAEQSFASAFARLTGAAPDADFSRGLEICKTATGAHCGRLQSLSTQAAEASAALRAHAQGLVGGEDYDGVSHTAYDLQSLINSYWMCEHMLQQNLTGGMQCVLDAYIKTLNEEAARATAEGNAPRPATVAPATPIPAPPP